MQEISIERLAARTRLRGPMLAVVAVLAGALALAAPVQAQSKPDTPSVPRSDVPGADIIECLDSPETLNKIEACTAVIDMPGIGPDVQARAYAMRALAFSLKLDYDRAIQDYDQAIILRPDFSIALNNRAWAYFKSGRAAQGVGDVEAAIRFDPLSAHSYDTRAHIGKAMGQKQKAIADYRRALRLADKKLITLYQCGLQNEGMFSGKQDGTLSDELYDAMERCMASPTCDPLPNDEECRSGTSDAGPVTGPKSPSYASARTKMRFALSRTGLAQKLD